MQTIQNLKETLFSDCKAILQKCSETENAEALIEQESNLFKLLEKVSLLKNLDSINEIISNELLVDIDKSNAEKTETENHIQHLKEEYWKTLEEKENQITELTSELKLSADSQNSTLNKENDLEEVYSKLPIEDFFVSQENTSEDPREHQETEKEENRRNIIEFNKKEKIIAERADVFEDFKAETAIEKKFRLGKIKGLNMVKSLFDDDLSDLNENVAEKKTPLQSSNMSADFMEAEKPKQDFRIDLNDKMAFTKLLFKDDEEDLKATISKLNSYKTLDEAKEYLSELYYENGWQKVDDYAQRLWVLVENKFI